MISSQRVKKLLLFLCKHLSAKEVEAMKGEIEEILGFDLERAAQLRQARRERESVTDALAATSLRGANSSALCLRAASP